MIVCVCHCVSDRDIDHTVRQGCSSFEDLQDELRVATTCGACRDCAIECFSGQVARIQVRRAAASSAGTGATTTALVAAG